MQEIGWYYEENPQDVLFEIERAIDVNLYLETL